MTRHPVACGHAWLSAKYATPSPSLGRHRHHRASGLRRRDRSLARSELAPGGPPPVPRSQLGTGGVASHLVCLFAAQEMVRELQRTLEVVMTGRVPEYPRVPTSTHEYPRVPMPLAPVGSRRPSAGGRCGLLATGHPISFGLLSVGTPVQLSIPRAAVED